MNPPRFLKLMDGRPFMTLPGGSFDYIGYTRVVKQAWAVHVVLRGGVVLKVESHQLDFGGGPISRFRITIRRNPNRHTGGRSRIKPRDYIWVDLSALQFRIIKSFCLRRFDL